MFVAAVWDINEYLLSKEECSGQICGNTIGSYMCYCSSGYKLSGDNSTCDDIDECLGPDHGCEQDCVNTVGSYNCNCSESYELNTDEHTCRDIDECLMELDECDEICGNTPGFYKCDCNSGYMLMPDNHTCKDIDECAGSDHGCEHNCTNSIRSYSCNCREGYTLGGDGRSCYVSCGGNFTDSSGSFNTPDWPNSYPSVNFSCVWEIVIDIPDASIVIYFNEPYGIHGSEPCESDYVEVLQGVGSNTTPLRKNCGTDVPENIEIESNRATVVFKGSASYQIDRNGVSISYKAVFGVEKPGEEEVKVVIILSIIIVVLVVVAVRRYHNHRRQRHDNGAEPVYDEVVLPPTTSSAIHTEPNRAYATTIVPQNPPISTSHNVAYAVRSSRL